MREIQKGKISAMFFSGQMMVACAEGIPCALGTEVPGAEKSKHRNQFVGSRGFKGGDPMVSRVGRLLDHIFIEKDVTVKRDGKGTILFEQNGKNPFVIKDVCGSLMPMVIDQGKDTNDLHWAYATLMKAIEEDLELKRQILSLS